MPAKIPIVVLIIFCYATVNGFCSSTTGSDIAAAYPKNSSNPLPGINQVNKVQVDELKSFNSELLALVVSVKEKKARQNDYKRVSALIDSINRKIKLSEGSGIAQSDSYYIIGTYYLLTEKPLASITYFDKSIAIREELNVYDLRLGRALYNLGVAYEKLGDFYKTIQCQQKTIEVTSKLLGHESIELIDTFTSLSSAYIELRENQKSVSYINSALFIAESKPDSVSAERLASLYSNLGVSYSRLANFSKAELYFEKAFAVYKEHKINSGVNYINLINGLANTYNALNLINKSIEYYEKGVSLALATKENSTYNFNIVNSYAILLANKGNTKRGEELLLQILKKAAIDSVNNPQLYCEVVCYYAEYLREYNIDNKKSLIFFSRCIDYLKKNPGDLSLKSRVYTGYSQSLYLSGELGKAIEIIQKLISSDYKSENSDNIFYNPDSKYVKPEKSSLKLFRIKYTLLTALFKENRNITFLEAAAATSELNVALLEKMRINISEEDSRLILGDRYRDAYFAAIGDYNLLYKITSDNKFLVKAFEYAEKSKVAGLLASTRELKASQLQIPAEVADYELRLKNEIGILNARIDVETLIEKPDSGLIVILKENLLKSTRLRDSLILVFENKFPEYYSMKYNTRVAALDDIDNIIGRNGNYINYLLSDTILFIFVANRKNNELIETPVNTVLFDNINKFRSLLSIPGSADDALSEIKQFKAIGNELYKILIEPILPFLVSDKLIISPDNILSYIPFETLPSGNLPDIRPQYRNIPYMMSNFDISYTYSATFMSEQDKAGIGFKNKVVAFAPNYPENIDIQSVLLSRQVQNGVLKDLPFARQEAKFVTDITRGKLYENAEAKESLFKKESGSYDIVHLAMHTLLNDKDPMHSTLIFSPESDTLEDRYLKTYEVYGLPLKAKMVVLSSCNTGSGYLFSGEGILSLARGFTYSGSQSVVMSMWEIEDRSGTEIVKMFYENIKKGYSKSTSLRKARIKYLKNSDQLRSHPYFWSALIVYGNNDPLYFPGNIFWTALVLLCVILLTVVAYRRRRRYS